jgi:hypothetical protein
METASTLAPAEVARAMVAHGVAKHRTRADKLFVKAVRVLRHRMHGPALTTHAPGPRGRVPLVRRDAVAGRGRRLGRARREQPRAREAARGLCVPRRPRHVRRRAGRGRALTARARIVLQGLELLTSNMMVMPIAAWKRAIPWWSVPANLLIGMRAAPRRPRPRLTRAAVTFGNLCGSLFFASVLANRAWLPSSGGPALTPGRTDSGLLSVDPYMAYAKSAALSKAAHPTWEQIFIRGIGCNWLVCVAIWVRRPSHARAGRG